MSRATGADDVRGRVDALWQPDQPAKPAGERVSNVAPKPRHGAPSSLRPGVVLRICHGPSRLCHKRRLAHTAALAAGVHLHASSPPTRLTGWPWASPANQHRTPSSRALQPAARRLSRRARPHLARRGAADHRSPADRLQHRPAAQRDRQPDAGGLCRGGRPRDATGRGAALPAGLRAPPRCAPEPCRLKQRTDPNSARLKNG